MNADNETIISTFGVKENAGDDQIDIDQITTSTNSLSSEELENRFKPRYQFLAYIFSFLIIYGSLDYMNNPDKSLPEEPIEDRIELTNAVNFSSEAYELFEVMPDSEFSPLLGPGESARPSVINEGGEEEIFASLVSQRTDMIFTEEGSEPDSLEEESEIKQTLIGHNGANQIGGHVAMRTLYSNPEEEFTVADALNGIAPDARLAQRIDLGYFGEDFSTDNPYLVYTLEEEIAASGIRSLPVFFDRELSQIFTPNKIRVILETEEGTTLNLVQGIHFQVFNGTDGTFSITIPDALGRKLKIELLLTSNGEQINPISNPFNPNDEVSESPVMNDMIDQMIGLTGGDLNDVESLRSNFAQISTYSLLLQNHPEYFEMNIDELSSMVYRNVLGACTEDNIAFANMINRLLDTNQVSTPDAILTMASGYLAHSLYGISYLGELNSHAFAMNRNGIVDATASGARADDIYTRSYFEDLQEFYSEMSEDVLSMDDLEEIIENFNQNLTETELEDENEAINEKNEDTNHIAVRLALIAMVSTSVLGIGRKLYKESGKIDTRKLKVLVAASLFYNAEIMSKLYEDPELYIKVENAYNAKRMFSNNSSIEIPKKLPNVENRYPYKHDKKNKHSRRKQIHTHRDMVDQIYKDVQEGKIELEQ